VKLLHIDSSILEARSVSRELSAAVVRAWQAAEPGIEVTYRDLALTPPPHLTGDVVATMKLGAKPSDAARSGLAAVEELLAEFLAADAIVIGAPMYNFSLPTQLKAWIDALAQPGRTFAYTPEGPRGLAGGRRVVIASSRGNIYTRSPASAMDFHEPYLVAVLKFMGITQIDTVRAEGVNLSPEHRSDALQKANAQITEMFADAQCA